MDIFSWLFCLTTLSTLPLAGIADELDAVEGNEFRDVWKASCWEMLEEVIQMSCVASSPGSPLQVMSMYDL